MKNWSMIIQSMKSCRNWLLDRDIWYFIFVTLILKTFNAGAKINQYVTWGCYVYLILCQWQYFNSSYSNFIGAPECSSRSKSLFWSDQTSIYVLYWQSHMYMSPYVSSRILGVSDANKIVYLARLYTFID